MNQPAGEASYEGIYTRAAPEVAGTRIMKRHTSHRAPCTGHKLIAVCALWFVTASWAAPPLPTASAHAAVVKGTVSLSEPDYFRTVHDVEVALSERSPGGKVRVIDRQRVERHGRNAIEYSITIPKHAVHPWRDYFVEVTMRDPGGGAVLAHGRRAVLTQGRPTVVNFLLRPPD